MGRSETGDMHTAIGNNRQGVSSTEQKPQFSSSLTIALELSKTDKTLQGDDKISFIPLDLSCWMVYLQSWFVFVFVANSV